MSSYREVVGRGVIAFLICLVPLVGAGLFSYFAPLTIVEMERVDRETPNSASPQRVDCRLDYRFLLVIPMGTDLISDVQKVESETVSEYETEITISGQNATVVVPASAHGQTHARDMQQFLDDWSESEYSVQLCSNLVVVLFLGGIGLLFCSMIIVGTIWRNLARANLLPGKSHRMYAGGHDGELPEETAAALKPVIGLTKFLHWNPGEFILFERRVTVMTYMFFFGFGAVLGSVFGGWLLDVPGALGAAVIGGLLMCSFIGAHAPFRSCEIDWSSERLTLREGWSRTRYPLRELDGLELTILEAQYSSDGDSGKTIPKYRAQLDVRVGDKRTAVIDTDDPHTSTEPSVNALSLLAGDLSEALEIPWSKVGFKAAPSFWSELRRRPFSAPTLMIGTLCVALLAAGWLGIQGFVQSSGAKSAIEAAGGEVSGLSSKGVANFTIITDGTSIRFTNATTDDLLLDVTDEITTFPKVDLELSESAVGDKAIAGLTGASNIWALNLTQTRITDAALESIGTMENLVDLNISITVISDAGLPQLLKLERLRFLSLVRTSVTDEGLKQLAAFKNLKRLTIGWGSVTPEGAKVLQELMPQTEVVRVGPPYEVKALPNEVTAANGQDLPADGGPQVAAIREYLKAIHGGDAAAALSAFASQVNKDWNPINPDAVEIRPTTVSSFSGFTSGDHATLVITGPTPDGSPVTYQYQMLLESGQWKIVRGRMQ